MEGTKKLSEIDSLHNMSDLLQCNLDRKTLTILLELMESGVHPEALAEIVNEFKSGEVGKSANASDSSGEEAKRR